MAQKPASKRITSEFLTKPNARMVRGSGNLSAFLQPRVEKVLMKKATILARKEGRDLVRAMLAIKGGGQWPTLETCLPPGSLLEQIYNVFLATTDIPSEIPVFAALHYISALLLQRDVVIEFADDTTRPDIWSVCLAESGAGKTYAQNKIKRALNANILMFGEFSSSA